jgi:hypothetical protein
VSPSATAFHVSSHEIRWAFSELEFIPLRFERLQFTVGRSQTKEVAISTGSGNFIAPLICRPYQDLVGRPLMIRAQRAQAVCITSVRTAWGTFWADEFDAARARDGCVRVRWSGLTGDVTINDIVRSSSACRP